MRRAILRNSSAQFSEAPPPSLRATDTVGELDYLIFINKLFSRLTKPAKVQLGAAAFGEGSTQANQLAAAQAAAISQKARIERSQTPRAAAARRST